jgi:hypothetical protein
METRPNNILPFSPKKIPIIKLMKKTIFEFHSYTEFLQHYVEARRKSSTHWSIGLWAKQLGLASTSTLTNILQGRRPPSTQLAAKIAKSIIELSPHEGTYFQLLVEHYKAGINVTLKASIENQMKLVQAEFSGEGDQDAVIARSIQHLLEVGVLIKTEKGIQFVGN